MKRTPLKRYTPIRPVSKKRRAYRQSAEGKAAVEWMGRVKGLPCVICNAPPPSDAHHCTGDGMARDDFMTIPLCFDCHRGPNGYHARKATWEAENGKDYSYVPVVRALLDDETEIEF